jgi:hypothetical protein
MYSRAIFVLFIFKCISVSNIIIKVVNVGDILPRDSKFATTSLTLCSFFRSKDNCSEESQVGIMRSNLL